MKPYTGTNAALALGVLLVMLTMLPGCQKEGPAEQAGREVDKAVTNMGEQMEKAGESMQDSAQR